MIDDCFVVSIYYTNDFKLSEHSNLWIHPHNLNFVRILSEYRKWWTAEGIIITRNKNYFLFLFLNWMIFPFYEHYDERENDKEKLPFVNILIIYNLQHQLKFWCSKTWWPNKVCTARRRREAALMAIFFLLLTSKLLKRTNKASLFAVDVHDSQSRE